MSDIKVRIASFEVGKAPDVLVSTGIGSCVVVCAYDPFLKIGGMAHIMLPSSHPGFPSINPLRFADKSIEAMIEKLKTMGSETRRLEAKIVGGANIFAVLSAVSGSRMGEENVRAVKDILAKKQIKVVAENTGGFQGRLVSFELETGLVTVQIRI